MQKAWILILTLIIVGISSFHQPSERAGEMIIGENEYGKVVREGPFGNPNSPDRIAYIVGVHPQESQAHGAIIKAIRQKDKTLKKCYYIYRVNVTKSPDDYEEGRLNGQLLAKEYVIPDIERMSIKLVIDVHSNVGHYDERRFLFVPYPSDETRRIANMITDRIGWLTLYEPPNPTSPRYVTIPLIRRGIPGIVYETYTYETPEETFKQALELILVIDSLSFS